MKKKRSTGDSGCCVLDPNQVCSGRSRPRLTASSSDSSLVILRIVQTNKTFLPEAPSAPKFLSNIAKPSVHIGAPTEKSRGRNMLLIRRSPSPSPVREPSPSRISRPRSGAEQSKARSDYEAYRAYHSRPPTPPRPLAPPSYPARPSPTFGRGSFVGDPVGPWLSNPQPHHNIAFSERSNNGSETSVGTGRKSARRGRYVDV